MAAPKDNFDIIIIGGGTSGLVLANRLTEDPSLEVLVLEAGANRNSDPKITTPGLVTQLFGDTSYEWGFNTVPQVALDGRILPEPQGKALGGSSAINAMTTNYPSPKMFDIWTQLGNKGWDAKTMASYYRKFQTLNRPSPEVEKELMIDNIDYNLHGTDGPIQTSFQRFSMNETKLWNPTLQKLGLKATGDPIAGEAVGSFVCPSYVDPKTATRSFAGNAYYEPVSSRPNLTLVLDNVVHKILFSKNADGSVITTGVQTASAIFHAKKEVILSAGAFNSPAILERSGIGNPDLLNSLGIDVVVSNPNVGENLQDHIMNLVATEVANENDSLDSLRDPNRLQEALRQYFEEKSGPLSSGIGAMAYLPVINLLGSEDTAHLKDVLAKYEESAISKLSKAQQIQAEFIKSIITDPKDSTCFTAAVGAELFPKDLSSQGLNTLSIANALVHPFSRGNSHIHSKDAESPPAIDPKYLSNPIDMEIFARHILFVSKLITAEPLASLLKPGGKMNPPSLANLEDAKDWARKASISQYHPCGTCAMMAEELGGVIDDKLRVYGTQNLRIVDASIFPIIPKGPITSSVYAVAERAADIIKADLSG